MQQYLFQPLFGTVYIISLFYSIRNNKNLLQENSSNVHNIIWNSKNEESFNSFYAFNISHFFTAVYS